MRSGGVMSAAQSPCNEPHRRKAAEDDRAVLCRRVAQEWVSDPFPFQSLPRPDGLAGTFRGHEPKPG